MARSQERPGSPQPAAEAASFAVDPSASKSEQQPPSPTRSDKSSESEGKPVREKLKETRIDGQASSGPAPGDQPMNDVPTNGTHSDNSTSGSESERGRLRRKRSREDFEDDHEDTKHPEKKHERHVRKKSRDITSPMGSDVEISTKPATTSVPPIREHESDETIDPAGDSSHKKLARPATPTPDATLSDQEAAITSPNNKRSREQAEAADATSIVPAAEPSKDSSVTAKGEDERDTKRPRDGVDPDLAGKASESTKIPPGSGFSNTSSVSPFAVMSPKPQAAKPTENPAENTPQTSSEAFKKSGFGSFASSSASPFTLGSSGSGSPFGAASGNKLTSFASKPASSTSTTSGPSALGDSSGQSAFGGSLGSKSAFGGSVAGSGFGSLGGTQKLTSFGSGAGITGLTQKAEKPFGAKEEAPESDSEGDDEDGEEGQGNDEDEHTEERRASQILLQAQGPPETGEENEDAVWNGRAKLYTFAGEEGKKTWHERGTGPFKLNVTRDPPTKARLILRADGTHRLLLNAAVTSKMSFGDAHGEEPQDGRILFTSPTSTGEVEQHLLKLRQERAVELWQAVNDLKKVI